MSAAWLFHVVSLVPRNSHMLFVQAQILPTNVQGCSLVRSCSLCLPWELPCLIWFCNIGCFSTVPCFAVFRILEFLPFRVSPCLRALITFRVLPCFVFSPACFSFVCLMQPQACCDTSCCAFCCSKFVTAGFWMLLFY